MQYFLRELSRDDIKAINQWRNDRVIINSLVSPFRYIDKEIDDAWFSSYLSSRSNTIRLAIAEKNSNSIIGGVYLTKIDWVTRSAEFAIWIGSSDHQGKGIGKFASEKLLAHAFLDLGLNRVYLTVRTNNVRAIRLYTTIGFKEEGVHRQAVFKNGKFDDLLQMGILASEFLKAN